MNLMLMLLILLAPRYIVLGLRTDASTYDKRAVKSKVAQVLGEPEGADSTAGPVRWRLRSNTNVVFWVMCIDKTRPHGTRPPLSITKSQFDAWRESNLDNPNHLRAIASDGPYQALLDAGLEPDVDYTYPPK